MYSCPGCGSVMIYDIPGEQLKCTHCERTESIESADEREARYAGASVGMDLYTCPSCGGTVQALNTAAAAFCSYCGSPVMLRQSHSEMNPPERIIPFHVTREECFEQYRDMLRSSPLVDRKLKKNVTAESFRGIYVPYHVYTSSVKGKVNLEGSKTQGNDTYYYRTTVDLNQRYDNILHDASKDVPDAMSERISRVPPSASKPFSPAYVSGFYADLSDTDPRAYAQYANAAAVRSGLREVLRTLPGSIHYKTKAVEENLISKVETTKTGDMLVPFWFMSIRSGKRVLYAIQNGYTGEMAADLPMDIPLFGLIALGVSIPLFFLLNSFLTLRPEMVLIIAMLLAFAAQLIVNSHRRTLKEKQDKADSAETVGDDFDERLRQRKRLENDASRAKTTAVAGVLGLIMIMFLTYVLSLQDSIELFQKLSCVLTAAFCVILFARWKRMTAPPSGSIAALLAMIAGTVILIANPFHSDDLPMYLVSFLCMGSVVWESMDLLMLYNRECSNPLPQFETHTGGEDHA